MNPNEALAIDDLNLKYDGNTLAIIDGNNISNAFTIPKGEKKSQTKGLLSEYLPYTNGLWMAVSGWASVLKFYNAHKSDSAGDWRGSTPFISTDIGVMYEDYRPLFYLAQVHPSSFVYYRKMDDGSVKQEIGALCCFARDTALTSWTFAKGKELLLNRNAFPYSDSFTILTSKDDDGNLWVYQGNSKKDLLSKFEWAYEA